MTAFALLPDADLALAAQHDQHAFAELFNRYWPGVVRRARHIAPNRDSEDVAQEVFSKVWRLLPRYDATRPFMPWLMGIAKNVALQARRGKCRTEENAFAIETARARPESGQHARDLAAAKLRVVAQKMNHDDWQLLALVFNAKRHQADLADQMGITYDALKSRIKHIRRRARLLAA